MLHHVCSRMTGIRYTLPAKLEESIGVSEFRYWIAGERKSCDSEEGGIYIDSQTCTYVYWGRVFTVAMKCTRDAIGAP